MTVELLIGIIFTKVPFFANFFQKAALLSRADRFF